MEKPCPDGRQIIREALTKQGVPESSMDIMISSISKTTLKNYEGTFNKWWRFCLERMIDFYEPSVSNVILFLTDEYEKGLSHSTLNCTRSALSLVIREKIAQDPRVQRFFQGISRLRPSKPKYNFTWDPKIVLDYFNSRKSNEELELKELCKKLITLFALVTAHRMQTFSLIKIENIFYFETKIEIAIPDRIKTSAKNNVQPNLVLPYFDNTRVCPAHALITYVERTKNIRADTENLFISNNKPIKAVSSQTLGRWVEEVLCNSGIDTTFFTAHSTRHAATSAANRLGVELSLIRKTAGWTENSGTFARFYNRDLITDNRQFALSILNN